MSDKRSPWAKPNEPEMPSPAPPRIPHLNYDDEVMPDPGIGEGSEGYVPDVDLAARIRAGKPGAALGTDMDRLMNEQAAEINREARILTGATLAQIRNPDFWRSLAPNRHAIIEVLDMPLWLEFESDGYDTMAIGLGFPHDLKSDSLTAQASNYDDLVKRLGIEMVEWCRVNLPTRTL